MTCNDKASCNFNSTVTGRKYQIINHTSNPLTCSSKNIIYLITCSRCGIQYVGETSQKLNLRMNNHRTAIRKEKNTLIVEHFMDNGGCDISHLIVQPIEQISCTSTDAKSLRLARETFWIKELRTLTPYGLNDRLDSQNWRYRSRNDIIGRCFNKLSNKRGCRGGGLRSEAKVKENIKTFNHILFMSDLKSNYDNLQNWRLLARKRINSINIAELRILSWKFIDIHHDYYNDFPREITNLVLDMINFRLFQHKEKKTSRKRFNFVKVFFSGKDIEKVKLASVFRKCSEFLPPSIDIEDLPTILYTRSKTIGSTVLNYKTTVDEVITNDWKSGNSFTCDCKLSDFCDPHHGHVVTGNLKFIKNKKLRSLLCKGPRYREARNTNWNMFVSDLKVNLKSCVCSWARREKVDSSLLMEWYHKVLDGVAKIVKKLKKQRKPCSNMILNSPDVIDSLSKLQDKFVFVPTDKASNNIAIVCKKFYIEQSMRELNIFTTNHKEDGKSTYELIDKDTKSIIERHTKYLKTKSICDEVPDSLPFLYWIPKMHKKPFSKQRYIAASSCCSTKPISAVLTKCLALIEKQHRFICRRYFKSHGINPMWIIHNSSTIHEMLATLNHKRECKSIRTYDFSTLYTNIPHSKLKSSLAWVIKEAFKSSGKSYISVYKNDARWTDKPRKNTLHLDYKEVTCLLRWLVDNIYVTFGDKCFRQVIGIPMGTDCAPFLANLFLYFYEYKWIDKQRKAKRYQIIKFFKNCGRYIDDLLMVNNNNKMTELMCSIYPKELELVPDDGDGTTAPFLDLFLTVDRGVVFSSIYDKRDNFDFPIVNFPTLTGNIPKKSSYGVFVGELVRYARACTYYEDFQSRTLPLVKKLKKQFFTNKLLKHTFISFRDSHIHLVQKYGSRILNLHNEWTL